jgi:hypothetical protein
MSASALRAIGECILVLFTRSWTKNTGRYAKMKQFFLRRRAALLAGPKRRGFDVRTRVLVREVFIAAGAEVWDITETHA